MAIIFLVSLMGAMYFVTIRPQQKRLRAQRALVASLKAGDEVVTAGGLVGRVTRVETDEIGLQVGPGVEVRIIRAAVTHRLGDGVRPA